MRRIAVIGHVEHITLGRVPALPGGGDIAHLEDVQVFPGGGGGVAFFQLARGEAEVHLFTAVGSDDAGRWVLERALAAGPRVHVYAAQRAEAHTRDVAMVPPQGDRTIVVVGQPLQPTLSDELPWHLLKGFDAAYFTAHDPAALLAARAARVLVVSARRQEALRRSGAQPDVVVGSAKDAKEKSVRADYALPPHALVMTEGERGGWVETAEGRTRFPAGPAPTHVRSSYGAGDSFAGALTYFLAAGLSVVEAATRASHYGAAVLEGWDPLTTQLPLPTF